MTSGQTRTITLTMEVTDDEAKSLVNKFTNQASAVTNDPNPATGEPVAVEPKGGPIKTTVETDDRNVPFHADYHAATKTKTAKGAWKKRKGADDVAKDAYEKPFIDGTANFQPAQPTDSGTTMPSALPNPVASPQTDTTEDGLTIPAFLQRTPTDSGATQPAAQMPSVEPTPVQMPAAQMPTTMPEMPAAAPTPITYEMMTTRYVERGNELGNDRLAAEIHGVYERAGVTDPQELATNETLRAAVVRELNDLQ